MNIKKNNYGGILRKTNKIYKEASFVEEMKSLMNENTKIKVEF